MTPWTFLKLFVIDCLNSKIINKKSGLGRSTSKEDQDFALKLIDNFADLKTNKSCRWALSDMSKDAKKLSLFNREFLTDIFNELEKIEKLLNQPCSTPITNDYKNVLPGMKASGEEEIARSTLSSSRN